MPQGIPKCIGLVPNLTKPQAIAMIPEAVRSLERLGFIHVTVVELMGKMAGLKTTFLTTEEMATVANLLIVFGGDGTYLHTARATAGAGIPIMGVNLGRLGFLTEIEIHELDWALEHLKQGDYSIEERNMVEAQVFRNGKMVHRGIALNDVVISNAGFVRMVELETYIDGEFLNSYPADGLIIATPTGSTAYSLSAGGPIVNPFSKALIITPICPHTLYSRSIVLSKDEVVRVKVNSDHRNCVLTLDGEYSFSLVKSDEVQLRRAEEVVRSVSMPGHTFYKILHDRMRVDRV